MAFGINNLTGSFANMQMRVLNPPKKPKIKEISKLIDKESEDSVENSADSEEIENEEEIEVEETNETKELERE